MKFNDGYWRARQGVSVSYATVAYEVEPTAGGVTVLLPTTKVETRGQTVNSRLITARFWSPAPDVIGVRLSHHGGGDLGRPGFDLSPPPGPEGAAQVDIGDDEAVVSAGALRARLALSGPWEVRFEAGGRALTASQGKAMGFAEVAGDGHYLLERLSLAPAECVYGLGERFTAFVKNGQAVDMWNADGGAASEQAYKNVPFYLSSAGYGVFVNNPGPVGFEVGSEVASKVQFSVAEHTLEYFVIYGPSPLEVLEKYTALTGRPALPPLWSFGLWLSTSFLTRYDEASVSALVDGMAERDLPLSVFHFDCFWMRELHLCDLEWDARVFPDPAGMLARFRQRGLHVCVWINPYIAEASRLFPEGAAQGFLLRRPGGQVWQVDDWQPGIGIVDFTNPGARAWFSEKLATLLKMGVDCFKTDFGERIPTDVEYFDGSDPRRAHNYFSFLYNRTVFETIADARGADQAVVFARSATAGGQRFPLHWGGDPESTYPAMAETLRGGLSLASSGFGFWAHDIGGFEGTPPEGLFKRWAAFGLLSSHSRLHGAGSYRAPWLYGDEAVEVLRHFTRLKMRLMPYLFATAQEAHEHGAPVLRPMFMEFAADPACRHLDQQYMLGHSLLVAPVFCDEGDVDYYLPEGRWTEFFTGATRLGGRWRHERHDFKSLPLLVRPGTLLAVGAVADRPDYPLADGVTIEAYELGGGDYDMDVPAGTGPHGARFHARRDGTALSFAAGVSEGGRHRAGPGLAWRVRLVGVHDARPRDGATMTDDERGQVVTAAPGATTVSVELSPATWP